MIPELIPVEQRLLQYGEAFDFYMDNGALPETLSKEDALGGYLVNTITSNPLLSSSDPLWKEELKGELLQFFEKLLSAEEEARKQCEEELLSQAKFAVMKIEEKRKMWQETYQHIKGTFSRTEVNIDGYVGQFKEHDAEAVLGALCNDWKNAAEQRLKEYERLLLEENHQRWEQHLSEWGRNDYLSRCKIKDFCYQHPQLREIIDKIGREKPADEVETDETVRRYLPLLVSAQMPVTEVEKVEMGDDLHNMLPMETAIMAGADTEILFFKRFASKQLQQFASRPKSEQRAKTVVRQKKEHRLEKGPIIVSIDTSGSMSGKPEMVAKSLLLQLVTMAKQQGRKCFVISFSVRTRHIELTKPEHWKGVEAFMRETYTGGTDGEEMLKEAFSALETDNFGMADILIISDFCFDDPLPVTLRRLKQERNKGTRFYGLQIGGYRNSYKRILDQVWELKI